MVGPYIWVPPTYWWDTEPARESDRFGAAFGFGSELGAGVGTPEIASLLNFLHMHEVEKLWMDPNASHYHMSPLEGLSRRTGYNEAMRIRYGPYNDTEGYLLKAQMMDYEATRAQFEAYAAKWNAKRPATGMIYWMLNAAWPSLHWQLFDFYMRPAGAYFGAKSGAHLEQLAYDYVHRDVYLINHSLNKVGNRTACMDIIDQNGKTLAQRTKEIVTEPNTSKNIGFRIDELDHIDELVFLRLRLRHDGDSTISSNIYWLPGKDKDTLDWNSTDINYTPVKHFANLTALGDLPIANVTLHARRLVDLDPKSKIVIEVENHSSVPAVFLRMNLVVFKKFEIPYKWEDVLPVRWEDNYLTLWPHEVRTMMVYPMSTTLAGFVQLQGVNVPLQEAISIVYYEG